MLSISPSFFSRRPRLSPNVSNSPASLRQIASVWVIQSWFGTKRIPSFRNSCWTAGRLRTSITSEGAILLSSGITGDSNSQRIRHLQHRSVSENKTTSAATNRLDDGKKGRISWSPSNSKSGRSCKDFAMEAKRTSHLFRRSCGCRWSPKNQPIHQSQKVKEFRPMMIA